MPSPVRASQATRPRRDPAAVLTAALVLLGTALVALALADRPVRRLPLSPALIYLVLGWLAGKLLASAGGPGGQGGEHGVTAMLVLHASALRVMVEIALLASLLAIGLRLRMNPTWREWHVALLLAGPGMLVTIALAAAAAVWLLGLSWPAALLLAAVLSPTDPVLASEVQIRHESDRDAVRVALTAEGALNDASASPVVALALALLGLHLMGQSSPGARWLQWFWADLLLPLGGGALLGVGLGWLLGRTLRARAVSGDTLARDELLHVCAVALSFGLAHAMGLSAFMVAFAVGATLLMPLRRSDLADAGKALGDRLHAFGSRLERLVEASTVLTVGALLSGLQPGWAELIFALLLAFVARPLAVAAVIRKRTMPPGQRRVVAWFGIRGLGSLYYLLLALESGVSGDFAMQLVRVTLLCIAMSIVLHGVSATPLMTAYQRRRDQRRAGGPKR